MIKVIRKGNIKRSTCGHCDALLEYDLNEDVKTIQQAAHNGICTTKFIKCPECGTTLILSEETR